MVSVEPPETMRRFSIELPRGARQRTHVDAAVAIEALVLERHQHGEVALVDISGFDGQAPASVRRREGAQQPVAPVEHRCRDVLRRLEVRRPEPVDGDVGAARADGSDAGEGAGTDQRIT